MGHTTRISDYEMDRAATVGPETDGVDIEAPRGKGNVPKEHMSESEIRGDFDDETVTKSKVVESEEKPEPKKSAAKSK